MGAHPKADGKEYNSNWGGARPHPKTRPDDYRRHAIRCTDAECQQLREALARMRSGSGKSYSLAYKNPRPYPGPSRLPNRKRTFGCSDREIAQLRALLVDLRKA